MERKFTLSVETLLEVLYDLLGVFEELRLISPIEKKKFIEDITQKVENNFSPSDNIQKAQSANPTCPKCNSELTLRYCMDCELYVEPKAMKK